MNSTAYKKLRRKVPELFACLRISTTRWNDICYVASTLRQEIGAKIFGVRDYFQKNCPDKKTAHLFLKTC